jgi:hypothetical protein
MLTVDQSRAADAVAGDRELQLVTARVRLLLDRQLAWREASAEQGWRDPWHDRTMRKTWTERDERGRSICSALDLVESAQERTLVGQLAQTFDLDEHDCDVLQICLAFALAPDLAGAFFEATGRGMPTDVGIATLLGVAGRRPIASHSPLLAWDLVHRIDLGPGEPAAVVIDPIIHDWFTGTYEIDPALIEYARPIEPVPPLQQWPVADVATQIHERWQRGDRDPYVRITVTAPEGSGRRSFAAAVAARLGLDVIAIDADAIDDASWPRVMRAAHRHAFLTRSALAFVGDSLARRSVELRRGFPLVFACVEPGYTPPSRSSAVDFTIELPPPTIDDRARLWRHMIPSWVTWGEPALAALSRYERTTPGDIALAARRGVTDAQGANAALRESGRDRFGDLARRLDCTFEWSDLVLPSSVLEILRDYEFEARDRVSLWEQPALRRMFPQGRGLFALFAGPPGTGKTMAAQVIAASLGVDLFRVALSEVVSKYVGETAKNLQKVLARAARMDVVLLFDEADALFSKRTEIKDAHDRYANSDTNHLLQAVESYSGIAILATNKRANIDHAFLRRLRYVVEFPQPEEAERLALWQRVIGELCGADALSRFGPALPAFASSIEMSGAQIKLAVLAGLFAARREAASLGLRHIVGGIDRELLKEGRSLTQRDRERLIHRA